MIDRQRVYEALDGERDYQIQRWGDSDPMSLAEVAVHLDQYVARLKHQLTFPVNPGQPTDLNAALHTLRKITTLGVAAMQNCGVVFREVDPK